MTPVQIRRLRDAKGFNKAPCACESFSSIVQLPLEGQRIMDTRIAEKLSMYRELVFDLERMEAGVFSAPDLMSVPLLEDWVHSFTIVSCLEGSIQGHPSFPDGHHVRTSEFITVFKDEGEVFARTKNSGYCVGQSRQGGGE